MFNPATNRITDTDNNHKRKVDDISNDPNEEPSKIEEVFHRIELYIDLYRFWNFLGPKMKNQLSRDRDVVFNYITRCYIDPLVELIKQNACNIYVSKRILLFLYPDYHMVKGVSCAYTELEKKLFA